MRRRFPLAVVLALAVVVSSVAVATPAPTAGSAPDAPTPLAGETTAPASLAPTDATAQVVPGENTTRMLRLDGPTTSGAAQVTVDISPSLGASQTIVATEVRQRTIDHRLDRAETTDQRRAILRQETQKVATQVAELRATERTTLRRYRNGDIGERALLRQLARVDTGARALESVISTLRRDVSGTPYMSATETELELLTVQLAMHSGPVREAAARAFRGESDISRFHVAVAGDAVVIATIRGNTYLREATQPANFDEDTSEQFASESEIFDRLGTLYPWAWDFVSKEFRTFKTGVYRVQVDHEHGQLTSYVDGSTGNVFREVQTKSLARLPIGDGVTAQANDTVLRVYPSGPSGPAEVTLATVTGEATDGTVFVDGERVGVTRNGALWLVSPNDDYTVTVASERGNVSITVPTA